MERTAENSQSRLARFVLRFSAGVLALCTLMLAFRPKADLYLSPLTEDGFLSLSVARQISLGNGVTYDGVTATNGFQPLWVFLNVPAQAMQAGDRLAGLRGALLLHWLFFIGTGWLIGLIARDTFCPRKDHSGRRLFWLALVLYLSGFFVFRIHFNGLETGCLAFLYALVWRTYQTACLDRVLHLCLLGLLLGLLVLARIDAVFFVILLSLWIACGTGAQASLSKRALRFSLVSGLAFLVSLPWWAYNQIVFGSLMPSSGTAQQATGLYLERLAPALRDFCRAAMPWIEFSQFSGSQADWLRGLLAAAFGIYLVRKARHYLSAVRQGRRLPQRAGQSLEFALALMLSLAILVAYYVLTSWATHFYFRYFSPISLLAVVLMSYLLWSLSARRQTLAALFCLGLAGPVTLYVLLVYTQMPISGRTIGDTMYTSQIELVMRHVPQAEAVGALETGTLGYFREHVINMDGKVNPEALLYQDNLETYFDKTDCDWYCLRLISEPPFQGWERVDSAGKFHLFRRM